jgi:hypothetical protein
LEHEDKPKTQQEPPPAELLAQVEELKHVSEQYAPLMEPLRPLAIGRTIVDSAAGHSGYILYLDDGTWVLCFLRSNRMEWESGAGRPTEQQLALLESSEYGDGRPALTYDYPYAWQLCDIAAEVRRSHGQKISGVAWTGDTFNFCFPDGHELDANFVMTADGKRAIRVFWEQW